MCDIREGVAAPTYDEMMRTVERRAAELGFVPGVRVCFGKRAGTVRGFNPFFYDSPVLSIYIDLDASGRARARQNELISVDELILL